MSVCWLTLWVLVFLDLATVLENALYLCLAQLINSGVKLPNLCELEQKRLDLMLQILLADLKRDQKLFILSKNCLKLPLYCLLLL